jgi:hypothetical protein
MLELPELRRQEFNWLPKQSLKTGGKQMPMWPKP